MRTARTIATVTRDLEEDLLVACDGGDVDRVREIVRCGANMNMICDSGKTPFCSAAHSGNVDVLKVLIDNATGESRLSESFDEFDDDGMEYSTDSCTSGGDTSTDAGEDTDSVTSDEFKASHNPLVNPCCCTGPDETDRCEDCIRCAPFGRPVPRRHRSRRSSISIRRTQKIKFLPYEIQAIMNSFATEDRDMEDFDVQDFDYGPDTFGYHFEGYGSDFDDYEFEGYDTANEDDYEDYFLEGYAAELNTPEDFYRGYGPADPSERSSEEGGSEGGIFGGVFGGVFEEGAWIEGNFGQAGFGEGGSGEGNSGEGGPGEGGSGEGGSVGGGSVDGGSVEGGSAEGGSQDGALDEEALEEESTEEDVSVEDSTGEDVSEEESNEEDVSEEESNDEDVSEEESNEESNDEDISEEEESTEDDGLEEDFLDEDVEDIAEGSDASDDVSTEEDSVAENLPGRSIYESLITGTNALTWRSGIFTKTDSLTRKIPNPYSLNKRDHFGCRAIHYATMGGHLEALRLLLTAGCRVNVGNVEQLSPVHMAAARDSPDELLLLIQAGGHVNVKTSDKITPLHVAASRGMIDNVKLLVRRGARVNSLDSVDRSPLFMAVAKCHKEVVSYLIRKGAKLNVEEIHGYTPLYEAVTQQNLEILKILIAAGAKLTQSQNLLHHAVLHKNEDVVRELIQAGCVVNAKEENGDTALMIAAKTLQPGIVKILLENGALVNLKNPESGEAALVQMTKNLRGKRESFDQIFSLFLKFDLDIDGETGYKALHYAIYNAEDAVAALLIRRGAIVFKNVWDVYAQLATDLFLEALLRENRLLLKLLIYAGYNFRNIRLPDRVSPQLLEWLKRRKSKPLKLSELCRIVVRSKLRNKVFEKVSFLNIPSSIENYIKLENIN